MQLKSKLEKPIIGVPVVEVKINRIAMALIKEQIFSPSHLLQKKQGKFIYAAVKKPATSRSVMVAITTTKE